MKKIIAVLAVLVPSVTMAQTPIIDATSLTVKLANLGNQLIGLLIAVAVIFIIWHAVMFILKASDPENRKAHREGVLWGIVGLVIILSIWGIVALIRNTFNTGSNTADTRNFPTVPPIQLN